MKSNAEKLKELADTVVLASYDLERNRVPIAHALLQKGLDAVGKIQGINPQGKPEECHSHFVSTMVALGYDDGIFRSFTAEGSETFYNKEANMMYDAWRAGRAA